MEPKFFPTHQPADRGRLFSLAPGTSLVLASTSPRRRELLSSLGVPFVISASDVREPQAIPGQAPEVFARDCALCKGRAWRPPPGKEDICVIAADTIVSIAGQILGKPQNPRHALEMLKQLNGATHEVITGLYLGKWQNGGLSWECLTGRSLVRFGLWPEQILAAYASCGEPDDKAGGYAIQGKGAFLVSEIQGSWTNVVGLPLSLLTSKLLELGVLVPASHSPDSGF